MGKALRRCSVRCICRCESTHHCPLVTFRSSSVALFTCQGPVNTQNETNKNNAQNQSVLDFGDQWRK